MHLSQLGGYCDSSAPQRHAHLSGLIVTSLTVPNTYLASSAPQARRNRVLLVWILLLNLSSFKLSEPMGTSSLELQQI